MRLPLVASLAFGLVLAAPSAQAQFAPGASAPAAGKASTAPHAMVSAANPLAVQAGIKVLKAGGGAVDAAVAIQAVLGLVEPQSSGLGGGAFMLHYDAAHRRVTAYDGREVAPAGATPDMFLGPDGRPLTFAQAVVSGRATGVPGAVAMLYLAQKEHGRLAWKALFGDAAALADAGFVVSPRLAGYLGQRFPQSGQPDVVRYFTKPDGGVYQAGDVLRNPAYAATLRRLAAEGPDAILKGSIAADIVARTHAEPLPGTMTLADLAGYKPRKTEALCRPYRAYRVCTPQLPSGGAALLELLGILERTDIAGRGPRDAQGWYLFAEASRLMYADRDQYLGDPAFVPAPVNGLLDPAYLKARAALIGETAQKSVAPGKPPGAAAMGLDRTAEPGGTSNFTVVDAHGDVVVMTTTVESIFGTGRMVDGFFVNNQLTDFSFSPLGRDGRPAANAVAPGKRPRSSMTPTLLLDRQGRFQASIGSPGGNSIIDYVGKTIVAMTDWKLSMPAAIALPNLVARGDVVATEEGLDPAIVAGLQARGMTLAPNRGENSGLHGAVKVKDGYLGAADPRREGIAVGF
ncbi:MAG TPA: gamma-glutamyltransferase family protein [Caulobacteraceae bacterium]|jgi:gamma-glutamyltranspeptidase/glutathione hydrolase|nr:gamma-glutamyltransferase family protein [Caulobacteraceae bacterium]